MCPTCLEHEEVLQQEKVMGLPIHNGTVIAGRFPSFAVINGAVLHQLGGVTKTLRPGESVEYRRHGRIRVMHAKDNHGRIEVTLPCGESHEAVIPSCKRLTLKDGHRHVENIVTKFGFVCPEWAQSGWDARECTIEPCTDGSYAVVDHNLQATVYVGKSRTECIDWLGNLD